MSYGEGRSRMQRIPHQKEEDKLSKEEIEVSGMAESSEVSNMDKFEDLLNAFQQTDGGGRWVNPDYSASY